MNLIVSIINKLIYFIYTLMGSFLFNGLPVNNINNVRNDYIFIINNNIYMTST